MNCRTLLRALTLGTGLALVPGAAGQSYSIQELPPLPGENRSYGFGINEAGVVVGQTGLTGGSFHATRWVNNVPESLGGLAPYPHSLAYDVNANDQAVGSCHNGSNGVPFIWENGVMAALPLPPGFDRGNATRINDSGVVIGYVYHGTESAHPCRWRSVGGQWIPAVLATPGNVGGSAEGINEAGIVVGRWWAEQGHGLGACSWDENGVFSAEAVGTSDARVTGAFDINLAGRIAAGYITANLLGRSELVNEGPTQPIGTLPGYAHLFICRINNSGTVLGHGYNGDAYNPFGTSIDCRAIVWRNGTLSALNDVLTNGNGWNVRQTWDVNERGQIAGLGTLNGPSNHRAMRLTPCYADFDMDGFVTGLDFDAFVAAFEAGDPASDFDSDGFVTGLDFDAYILEFEVGC